MYLRIDSTEQAIRESPGVTRAVNEEGYRVAYAIAEDKSSLRQDADFGLCKSYRRQPRCVAGRCTPDQLADFVS
jgi:hypothetical protein